MICPINLPNIRDKILEHVSPKHARSLRLVSHDWNKSAVGALAAASNCLIRVTHENVDEYVSSRLLRGSVAIAASPTQRLKIALDFGPATTRAEFQHLIDVASNLVLAQDGPDYVAGVKFHGAHDSFAVGPQEWSDLLHLLQLAAPGLRELDLFDRDSDWTLVDGTLFHQQHCHGKLRFPQLEELAYCWQEPTMFLLDAMLLPGVAPRLKNVQLTVRDAAGNSLFPLALRANIESLQNYARLTELTLALDLSASGFLARSPAELRSVRRLCLHILKNCGPGNGAGTTRDGGAGLFGGFIGRMFPEIRTLDLRYEPVEAGSEPDSWIWFPWELGPLLSLESLGYGWIAAFDGPTTVTATGLLHVEGSELGQNNNFPALKSVSTDLGFELSNTEPEELKLPAVQRLELRLGTSAVATLTSEELQRCADNLHGLYPQLTCLGLTFDLGSSQTKPGRAQSAHTVKKVEILVREFRGLEEIEILGCECDKELPKLVQEATEALRLVIRTKTQP